MYDFPYILFFFIGTVTHFIDLHDLKDGKVGAWGCVSRPFSHPLVTSRGALKTWKIWSVDIKIPLLQAARFGCKVFFSRPDVMGSLGCTSHSEIACAGLCFE